MNAVSPIHGITRRVGIGLLGAAVAAPVAAHWLFSSDRPDGSDRHSLRPAQLDPDTLTPEQFGAKGDGKSDDSEAISSLAQSINARGGGTIAFRAGAIYRVGRQVFAGQHGRRFAFENQPIFGLRGVKGVRLHGNGATFMLNDGLRFGSFDPVSGVAYQHDGKFVERDFAATIGFLVEVIDCEDVVIEDLLLDGNIDRVAIGGAWGDTGIQRAATGLKLYEVSRVTLRRIIARNHGQDGFYISGRNRSERGGADDGIRMIECRAERNGRQGMSIVGGRGFRASDCVFVDTAQGPVSSAPRAGVDIEPNNDDWASDTYFERCRFENNAGPGILADTGNSQGLMLKDCTFWQGFAPRKDATLGSGDALWCKRGGVRVVDCTIDGAITNLASGAQVSNCQISNRVHPRYGQAGVNRRFLLKAGGTFTDCRITVTGDAGTGLFYAGDIFRRCIFTVDTPHLRGIAYVALVGEKTVMEDCSFRESTKVRTRMFIKYDGGPLRGSTTVSGPQVRWKSIAGPIGRIAKVEARNRASITT